MTLEQNKPHSNSRVERRKRESETKKRNREKLITVGQIASFISIAFRINKSWFSGYLKAHLIVVVMMVCLTI